jgi:hypothetical protein
MELICNLGASGWLLSDEQINRLNQASEVPLPYSYEQIERARQQR